MPSACALGTFSGKISYNRATADSLRAVRCCIFTERVQEGNLICLCLFPAETAAQPGNRPLLHCARSSEKASQNPAGFSDLHLKNINFLNNAQSESGGHSESLRLLSCGDLCCRGRGVALRSVFQRAETAVQIGQALGYDIRQIFRLKYKSPG